MTMAETIGACKSLEPNSYVIKIDFAGAFDSINWSFIEQMLRAKGFPDLWISWISCLIRSSASSIIVNGTPSSSFNHRQGLRQGNPLSPLIFNLVVDTLSRLITSAVCQNMFHGVLQDFIQDGISHMLYVDDLIMFAKANNHCFSWI
ncbi:hypothetical protein Cni_G02629 [Canna indica]|uniref:Reverse transcriptase domain-containing protein n=1 Tax=Canna indica TaxID=4628 RepID=A0AAQ3JR76_9LILI|nr:hypothetical protein Cni_G02629 [Canna indica]